MLSAFTFLHFHGQTLRLRALRRDGRGLFAYRVRKQDGAQWAPSFFSDLWKRDLAPGGLRNRGNPG
jgi:hypothetical protein